MFYKLKSVVVYLKFISSIILLRNFGLLLYFDKIVISYSAMSATRQIRYVAVWEIRTYVCYSTDCHYTISR